jgi:hypothetical protein
MAPENCRERPRSAHSSELPFRGIPGNLELKKLRMRLRIMNPIPTKVVLIT